jgi:hypothetical protein
VKTTPLGCQPYIDALNPAFSNSSPVVGPNGLCPTGRYTAASQAEASAAMVNGSNFPSTVVLAKADDVAQDILARGFPIPLASPYTATGPASATGTPTTTTTVAPGGATTTTTTTPTTNYTYAGDTITYNTTNVTVTNNAGAITTTTTTTPAPDNEPTSECAKNPNTVGCMKPGDLPTDAPVWQTRTVDYGAENLGFTGACPAPVTWVVFGLNLTWSYQPICDIAWMVRLALLIMAGLSAAGIVVRETS